MEDAGLGRLQSARLRLRRFTTADLPLLIALNSDAEVMRYLGGPEAADGTRTMLEGRILGYYEQQPGLGVWATEEIATGRCIGFHLLNHIRETEHIEVGYRLFREAWGRGFATEMTVALLRYGFANLGLPQITAITHVDNRASQAVLLRAGLERRGLRRFSHPHYATYGDLAWFERDAEPWLAGAAPH